MTGKKIRAATIRGMEAEGKRIVAVTAYDTITAAWAEAAGVDLILIGDSLARGALGLEREYELRLEQMLLHCAAVARGARRPLRVGDMPFMTYKISPEQALATAGRMVQEGGCEAVKLEGGTEMAPTVRRLVQAGIPVLGHVGLLPQAFHAQGGYTVQGRESEQAARLLEDAKALEAAGAFALVVEGMPSEVAKKITQALAIPTIGIGAGAECNGQILVMTDVLGMTGSVPPKLAKVYADVRGVAVGALEAYVAEVREGTFPGVKHTY